MTKNDIFLLLARILGPLKANEQRESSQLDKFTDVIRHVLTQPSPEIKRTGLQFPDSQGGILSDVIEQEFDTIADEIIAAQPMRNPADPVYWMRQRNVNVKAGIEDILENFLESTLIRRNSLDFSPMNFASDISNQKMVNGTGTIRLTIANNRCSTSRAANVIADDARQG